MPRDSRDSPSAAPAPRLLSIDALRGFDMFWIMGGENIAKALARWGDWSIAPVIETQLEHAAWEGFRFYDLIYPLFLFIVGLVLPFSQESLKLRQATGQVLPGGVALRILRRTALLFLLGLFCNDLLQFDFENLRITGVLQRIALCYGAAALIVWHTGWRLQGALCLLLLLGYWGLLAFVGAPGFPPGDYSIEGNLPGYLDRTYLPGKILPEYYGYGDNEGLLSTIPAVVTTLLGALAGQWLRSPANARRKVAGLLLAGLVALALGYGWGLVFPIIKNIWTSSFVLVAAGYSLGLVALFYGVIDGLGWRRWAFPFIVIGSNAILIYVLPNAVNFEFTARFLFGGIARLSGSFAPVALTIAFVFVEWLLLLALYRRRIFLRV